MTRRVTLRDIGRAVGFHHTTVSLALRDDPQIPEHTRAVVRRAAEEMGYHPDPLLKALAVHRLAGRRASEQGVLAWLTNTAKPGLSDPNYSFIAYVEGARRRAESLGFQIEEFLLRAPGMTPARMSRILRTRGIQGLLIAPQPWGETNVRLEMEWNWFSAVTFGYTLGWPVLDLVADHHFDTVRIAFRKLQQLGYRRIGLYINDETDRRANRAFSGGFISEMMQRPRGSQLFPILYKGWREDHLRTWMASKKPDALIVDNTHEISLVINALKVRIPDDLALVSLNHSRTLGHACIRQKGPEIGAKAVDLLVGMINLNQRGIPANPARVLLEAAWQPGWTVRSAAPAEAA